MNSFDFLINHTPTTYIGEENTRKQIKIWADLFDLIISYVDFIPAYHYIDTAPEEWLELLGLNVGRPRKELEDLEIYRQIIKIQYYNTFVVPTHNELLRITKNVTGAYPFLKPLWEQLGTNFSTNNADAAYYLSYDVTQGFPTEVLDELEKFYPAGVKLIRDYLFKIQNADLKSVVAINNTDTISVGFKKEV